MSLKPGLKFRDFVQALKNNNDLVEISEEVDPNLELGAIMRKAYEEELPAPLFTNVKGAKDGLFDVLGCPAGLTKATKNDHSRVALHLGLPSETHMRDIIQFLVDTKKKDLVPPHDVPASEAPCKQNILKGDQVNLNALPAPLLHPYDGGKYLQTYGMFVLETPDKKWTNWSIARAMIKDDKHLTGLVINPQHIRQVADKWAEAGKGRKIPYALCFGVPPAAILVSSMPIPAGVSEGEYIGALLGESLPVVKTETSELVVPATSEIVLEGTLDLEDLSPEGPFGEMHGYCFDGQGHPCPTYSVDVITHRDNAIMPVSNPGVAVDETHTFIGGLVAAENLHILQQAGLPVLEAFTPYYAQALVLAVKIDTKELRKLKTTPQEFCKKIGDTLFNKKPASIIHEVVLVSEDVDIFNFRDFYWAYVTRHAPVLDQVYFPDVAPFPLAPFVSQSDLIKTRKGGKCVTNAIFHPMYNEELSYVKCDYANYDASIREKVESNWTTYGYKN